MDSVHRLLASCEEGNVSTVENLFSQFGLDVNCVDEDDATPLQVSAANGHEHVVRVLLMRGATVDKPNSMGWTPLLLACRHGHARILSLLLQYHAEINARNRLGANAMVVAARGGHLKVCKLLIEAGIEQCSSLTNGGCTVGGSTCEFSSLMVAASHGHDTTVRYLLDRGGFDVNEPTFSTGLNALMLAALNGHVATVQVLFERGVDPNLTNVNGSTALDMANATKKREVKGYLERKTTKKTRPLVAEELKPDIIEATKRGDINIMKEILERDPKQKDACQSQDGATPLMFAAIAGRLDITQLLVEAGCDIDKQDVHSGWTALMQAIYHGRKHIVKYLISAGADVLIPAKNGCNAFDLASLTHSEDVDTEVVRLIATKAMQISRSVRKSSNPLLNTTNKSSNGQVTLSSAVSEECLHGEQRKIGLKAWWSRMSNRFRNLKLGTTFNLNTNRLAPMPDVDERVLADTEKLPSSQTDPIKSKHREHLSKAASLANVATTLANGTADRSEIACTMVASVANSTTVASQMVSSTMTSYEAILSDTKKLAKYTVAFTASSGASLEDRGLVKPVSSSPFLPAPTFDTVRLKMPPANNRRISSHGSSAILGRRKSSVAAPVKLLSRHAFSSANHLTSAGFLESPPSSPPPRLISHTHNSNMENISPSSSGGATDLSGATDKSRAAASSTSSSTLTAGSEVSNVPSQLSSQHRSQVTFRHENSAVSSHKKHSRKRSGSSKESTSTLTPPNSPIPKQSGEGAEAKVDAMASCVNSAQNGDEISGILRKLSLENYQSIFEQEEVDMEAFLTLSDQDLKDLGISQQEPRQQILAAITELSSGSSREAWETTPARTA